MSKLLWIILMVKNQMSRHSRAVFALVSNKPILWITFYIMNANLTLNIHPSQGTMACQFVPVLCGAAFKNKGVQPLLDSIIDYLPSPMDVQAIKGIDPKNPVRYKRVFEFPPTLRTKNAPFYSIYSIYFSPHLTPGQRQYCSNFVR